MLWQPGLILNDTYRIDRQFDGGGFGVVYQATDLKQKRTVAIKTLNPIQITGDRFQAEQVKFINEAMKLAKFKHRHIIEVFEVVVSNELFGMVTEFVRGQNLAECLQQWGKPFEESKALGYIRQVGEALALLHDHEMLHRDVKPLNIMQREENRDEVVLIDFGLARELQFGVTQTFTNAGTPAYAAPEQFRHDREQRVTPGAYTDVYGLAATLYALLTNQNPFPAEFRLQGAKLIDPRQHNGLISERVSRAILRGMELDVSERLQTIEQFCEELGIFHKTRATVELELVSERGVNYRRLLDLLKAEEWEEADDETATRMLEAAGTDESYLSSEDIACFPCEDLRTIDRLWGYFSHGKFGFSAQEMLLRTIIRQIENDSEEILDQVVGEKFYKLVGWHDVDKYYSFYDSLIFDTSAPYAHLPALWTWSDWVEHPPDIIFTEDDKYSAEFAGQPWIVDQLAQGECEEVGMGCQDTNILIAIFLRTIKCRRSKRSDSQ